MQQETLLCVIQTHVFGSPADDSRPPTGVTSGKGTSQGCVGSALPPGQTQAPGQGGGRVCAGSWPSQPLTQADASDTAGRQEAGEGSRRASVAKTALFSQRPLGLPSNQTLPAAQSNARLPSPTPALIFPVKYWGEGGKGTRPWRGPCPPGQGVPHTSPILGPTSGAPLRVSAQTPGQALHRHLICPHPDAGSSAAWPSVAAGHPHFPPKALPPKSPSAGGPAACAGGSPEKGRQLSSLELSGAGEGQRGHLRCIQAGPEGPAR